MTRGGGYMTNDLCEAGRPFLRGIHPLKHTCSRLKRRMPHTIFHSSSSCFTFSTSACTMNDEMDCRGMTLSSAVSVSFCTGGRAAAPRREPERTTMQQILDVRFVHQRTALLICSQTTPHPLIHNVLLHSFPPTELMSWKKSPISIIVSNLEGGLR